MIEDINSEKVQAEISNLAKLQQRTIGARFVTLFGAILTSFWLLYRVFIAQGFFVTLFCFIGLSIVYKFGASPMFAVAASALYFHFRAVGVWLPITSYIVALILLYVDLRISSLKRRVDPYNLGSIYDA